MPACGLLAEVVVDATGATQRVVPVVLHYCHQEYSTDQLLLLCIFSSSGLAVHLSYRRYHTGSFSM